MFAKLLPNDKDTIQGTISHTNKGLVSKHTVRSVGGSKYVKLGVKSMMNNNRMFMIFSNRRTFLTGPLVFPRLYG